jgi:ribonuclease E
MTFTEAAVEVLRREGKPLHFKQIAEIAARENLLDHVGKIPEETMAGQLVAHCRLPHGDRLLHAVEHGIFALVEWQLPEDPAGIENLVEAPPEEELPYRGNERHPVPSRELARGHGRGERGRRREEGEERRGKRFPPPAEVAYEILAGAGRPIALVEIAAQGAERLLMPDAFVRDVGSLRSALQEDNRRRESSGRRALFALEGDDVTLVAQPEPGERAAAPVAGVRLAAGAGDLRKAALAALRRRLRECDGPTFENVAGALLARLGYSELKVVKRGREHAVYVGRRRLGAAEIRHVFRVVRAHADVGRRDVQDLRRDLGNYGAQIGLVVATGDVQREARGDATAGGQLPVVLLCGEALAEAFAESATGCRQVIVPELDEGFFREAALQGAAEEEARRARREERDKRRGDERRRDGDREEGRGETTVAVEAADDGTPEAEGPPEPEQSGDEGGPVAVLEVRATLDDEGGPDDDEEDGAEGEEEAEPVAAGGAPAATGQPGEGGEGRRRRRRRRRRRGGRGRREGTPGEAVGSPQPAGEGAAPSAPSEGAAPAAPPEPPPQGGGEPSGAP